MEHLVSEYWNLQCKTTLCLRGSLVITTGKSIFERRKTESCRTLRVALPTRPFFGALSKPRKGDPTLFLGAKSNSECSLPSLPRQPGAARRSLAQPGSSQSAQHPISASSSVRWTGARPLAPSVAEWHRAVSSGTQRDPAGRSRAERDMCKSKSTVFASRDQYVSLIEVGLSSCWPAPRCCNVFGPTSCGGE